MATKIVKTLGFGTGDSYEINAVKLEGKSYEDILNLLVSYYTKSEIDAMEFITVSDIDTICGGAIQYAEDVLF